LCGVDNDVDVDVDGSFCIDGKGIDVSSTFIAHGFMHNV
jgi:hypothetical protein